MQRAKKRKCKAVGCHNRFEPLKPFQMWCSDSCGALIGVARLDKIKASQARKERKELAQRRIALKSVSDYAKEAQTKVNEYVKWRDWGKDCVSCGRPHKFDVARDASHLKSRGANSFLRFNLWNLHMACVQCNMNKSGNIAEYYPRLIERIGQKKVDYLNSAPRSREYSIEYLLRLKDIFTLKAKRMKARMG